MAKNDKTNRPVKPQNEVIMGLRQSLGAIYDFLGTEEAAPILARHFGVNKPEQVEATGLIEAIDKMHNRADEIATAQADAEAKAVADAEAEALAAARAEANPSSPILSLAEASEAGDPVETQ